VAHSEVPLCVTDDPDLASRAARWCDGAALAVGHPALDVLARGLVLAHGDGSLQCAVVRDGEVVAVPVVRTRTELDALCQGVVFVAQVVIAANGQLDGPYLNSDRPQGDESDLPADSTGYVDPPDEAPQGMITVCDRDASAAKTRALNAALSVCLAVQSGAHLREALGSATSATLRTTA
jgi:hypothetical protein